MATYVVTDLRPSRRLTHAAGYHATRLPGYVARFAHADLKALAVTLLLLGRTLWWVGTSPHAQLIRWAIGITVAVPAFLAIAALVFIGPIVLLGSLGGGN